MGQVADMMQDTRTDLAETTRGWTLPHPGALAFFAPMPLMRAILAADDAGRDRLFLPDGRSVCIHPRLVSVAAGMGRCKLCGEQADTAVEIATGAHGKAALWFVSTRADGRWKPMTSDHIVPESWGGATHQDNLRCLCQPCNGGKAARLAPGVEVERRYHLSDLLSALAVANPHGSPGRSAYRRFLSDRADGSIGWLPTRQDYLSQAAGLRLLRGLLSDYGLHIPRNAVHPKLFPAMPVVAPVREAAGWQGHLPECPASTLADADGCGAAGCPAPH